MFEKYVKFLAIFLHLNGNFSELQFGTQTGYVGEMFLKLIWSK